MLSAVTRGRTIAKLRPPSLLAMGHTNRKLHPIYQLAVKVSGQSRSGVTDLFEPESQTLINDIHRCEDTDRHNEF